MRCEHEHPTRADREACDAMAGRVRSYPDDGPIHGREYLCALCGHVDTYGDLLWHFRYAHEGGEGADRLIRPIRVMGEL